MGKPDAVIVISAIVIVLTLSIGIYTFTASGQFHAKSIYEIRAEESGNHCLAHEGFTQEIWDKHMSLHPEEYADCIKEEHG